MAHDGWPSRELCTTVHTSHRGWLIAIAEGRVRGALRGSQPKGARGAVRTGLEGLAQLSHGSSRAFSLCVRGVHVLCAHLFPLDPLHLRRGRRTTTCLMAVFLPTWHRQPSTHTLRRAPTTRCAARQLPAEIQPTLNFTSPYRLHSNEDP